MGQAAMPVTDAAAVTQDALLGGRVLLTQPLRGFRAGSDAGLLAAAVPAWPGQRVLDLGCGTGPALLCLAARVPGLDLHGLDLQPDLVALAQANMAANGFAATITAGDVRALPSGLAGFDHVLANPPYFRIDRHHASPRADRATARTEGEASLADWCRAAIAATRPGGTVTIIQRADRLDELLAVLPAVTVLPLAAQPGAAPKRVIVRSAIGASAPPVRLPPMVLHRPDGPYNEATEAILRHAAPLLF